MGSQLTSLDLGALRVGPSASKEPVSTWAILADPPTNAIAIPCSLYFRAWIEAHEFCVWVSSDCYRRSFPFALVDGYFPPKKQNGCLSRLTESVLLFRFFPYSSRYRVKERL